MTHQLVTIAFSHFCEKARWALDRYGVPYREARCMPLLHVPVVLRHTGRPRGTADSASSILSTPVLITNDREILTDSTDILEWVDRHHAGGALYPEPAVVELERELGVTLGPSTRRFAYFHILPQAGLMQRLAEKNVSKRHARSFALIRRPVTEVIRRKLKVDAAGAAKAETRVREWVDRIDARLSDSRPYLFGDHFTAADLTFAALMAPAVLPREFGAYLPREDELASPVRALIREMRERPAGQFALRMFSEERGPRAPE